MTVGPTRGGAEGRNDLPSAAVLHEILRAGIQAPSAENQHYFRFERTADGVTLVSTDVPTWQPQPHRRMLALLSYGAVAENMALRSAARGFHQHTRWWPSPARPEAIAEFRWSPAPPAGDALEAAIERRHTNRRFYRRIAVPADTLQHIAAAAGAVQGARLLWLDDPSARSIALRTIRLAETERFRREGLHRELFKAIRFDVGWQRTVEEGLPPGALEVERPMRALFAAMAKWPRMRAASLLGLHRSFGLRAGYLPCAGAPHLGLVLCDAPQPECRPLLAGRALQRAWLAATANGLAFQPMAAAVALARQRAGSEWVSPAVQARLREGLARLAGGDAENAWMLLRIGLAEEATVRTARPPLEHFFVAS